MWHNKIKNKLPWLPVEGFGEETGSGAKPAGSRLLVLGATATDGSVINLNEYGIDCRNDKCLLEIEYCYTARDCILLYWRSYCYHTRQFNIRYHYHYHGAVKYKDANCTSMRRKLSTHWTYLCSNSYLHHVTHNSLHTGMMLLFILIIISYSTS